MGEQGPKLGASGFCSIFIQIKNQTLIYDNFCLQKMVRCKPVYYPEDFYVIEYKNDDT